MSYNVPAVYDGLTARIRACEARPGLANYAGARRGSERSDRPSRMEAKGATAPAAYTVLLCVVWVFPKYFYPHNYCKNC